MDSRLPLSPRALAEEIPLSLGESANILADTTAHARYSEKKAQNTLRRQHADLALFFRFLSAIGYPAPIQTFFQSQDWMLWQGVTYGLVEGFVEWMKSEGYAVGSIRVRLSTVKTYSRLAHRAHAFSQENYLAIKGVESYGYSEGINLDAKREVTRLGRKKEHWTIINPSRRVQLKTEGREKDQALMCFLLEHGLRCSEIQSLTLEGLNLEEGTFSLYRVKVKKSQTHYLTPDSQRALLAYLVLLDRTTGPLFTGHSERPMSTQGINKRVGELGVAVGIESLSPHDCRHDWATRIARKNKTELKNFVTAGGWNSPAMALRYVEEAKIANEGVVLD